MLGLMMWFGPVDIVRRANEQLGDNVVADADANAEPCSVTWFEHVEFTVRRCKLTHQVDPALKALVFQHSLKVRCVQAIGFKCQLAPLHHGGYGVRAAHI